MHGENQLCYHLTDRVSASKMRLKVFQQQQTGLENFICFHAFMAMLQMDQDIGTQGYTRILKALIHSFGSRFQDFEQCKQRIQVFEDLFAVPVD